LSIYISLLSNFRNLCAHEDILYDHKTGRDIPDTKYHYELDIEMNEDGYIYGKNDLFALIIIMKQLFSENEFIDLINEIEYIVAQLDGRLDVIEMDVFLNKVGFPKNWSSIVEL